MSLVQQLGPSKKNFQNVIQVEPWEGGGVPGGGQAHTGHANWFTSMNPPGDFNSNLDMLNTLKRPIGLTSLLMETEAIMKKRKMNRFIKGKVRKPNTYNPDKVNSKFKVPGDLMPNVMQEEPDFNYWPMVIQLVGLLGQIWVGQTNNPDPNIGGGAPQPPPGDGGDGGGWVDDNDDDDDDDGPQPELPIGSSSASGSGSRWKGKERMSGGVGWGETTAQGAAFATAASIFANFDPNQILTKFGGRENIEYMYAAAMAAAQKMNEGVRRNILFPSAPNPMSYFNGPIPIDGYGNNQSQETVIEQEVFEEIIRQSKSWGEYLVPLMQATFLLWVAKQTSIPNHAINAFVLGASTYMLSFPLSTAPLGNFGQPDPSPQHPIIEEIINDNPNPTSEATPEAKAKSDEEYEEVFDEDPDDDQKPKPKPTSEATPDPTPEPTPGSMHPLNQPPKKRKFGKNTKNAHKNKNFDKKNKK